MKNGWRSLAAVCAMVIGVYAYMAQSGDLELLSSNAADANYNLLVQGFRAGQLNLKKEVPPGFAQLADPYDPAAHLVYQFPPYRLLDLSYYKDKLYLYWGATPVLILFWPYVTLTGHYLSHSQAIVIFCALGFLGSVGLLCALWRRYFSEVNVGVVVACMLALGLATGLPVLLSRADVYEVAISCEYLMTMLALGAIWRALHEPGRRWPWLAAASLAYGLAVGARPSLLFGAAILLVPVAQAWRERQRTGALLLAATGPIVLIGLGLLLYNARRFGNPFEFGQHYQLNAERRLAQQSFNLRYFWFNFRIYFLEPARWSAHFPFVHDIIVPPLPPHYDGVEGAFGVLTNMPLVWLALAVPLAWRSQSRPAASMILRWFVTTVALLFGIGALTLGLFCGANFRYEVDFLPALVLLAVVGILGLERALTDRPAWRRAVRWGWGLLLGFSVAFNLLASVEYYATAHNLLGLVAGTSGRVEEAIAQYEQVLRLDPDYVEAHNNLGVLLARSGRMQAAAEHWEQALRITPNNASLHYNLANALARMGRTREAMEHWEQALRIQPDFATAHCNLGVVLAQAGETQKAMEHFEQALRIKPDLAEAHYNLGLALARLGRVPEAIGNYEQALRIKPDYADAQNALTRLQAGQ